MIKSSTRLVLFVITLAFATACKKEVEKIVVQEVDKQYSWQAVEHLRNLSKIILNTTTTGNSLLLQSPTRLGILAPRVAQAPYFISLPVRLPTDITVRIPLTPSLIAWPINDTTVVVQDPQLPAVSYYNDAIRLRQLDPQATSWRTTSADPKAFAAINRNNYLLMSYYRQTSAGGPPLRLVLAHAQPTANDQIRLSSRLLSFPGALSALQNNTPYVGLVAAIDDYFLISLSGVGLYKVQQDGTVRQVYAHPPYSTDDFTACYKWRGQVYAYTLYNQLLVSGDDGETWRVYKGVPSFLAESQFRVVNDSVVGFIGRTHQLYTLRLNNGVSRVRELKNDGLGQVMLTGLEQLGDTMYLGSTSGLFRRPLNKFFDSQP